jgi:arsenate reductase (glutaredoxin)
MKKPLVLSYSGCSTCKKALKWLAARGIEVDVRPIVEAPPTLTELSSWVRASGKPLEKWLNASGQSYRALGKDTVKAASHAQLMAWLAQDGKLVKRPVLVSGTTVLVGFKEDEWKAALSP